MREAIRPRNTRCKTLQSTASIAGRMITTECMVAELPKKEEPHNHGAPGGMGGMDF